MNSFYQTQCIVCWCCQVLPVESWCFYFVSFFPFFFSPKRQLRATLLRPLSRQITAKSSQTLFATCKMPFSSKFRQAFWHCLCHAHKTKFLERDRQTAVFFLFIFSSLSSFLCSHTFFCASTGLSVIFVHVKNVSIPILGAVTILNEKHRWLRRTNLAMLI